MESTTQKLALQQLESHLWESANTLRGGQLIAPIIKTTSSVFGMGWTGPYSQGYSALSLEIYHEEDEGVNRSENKRKFDMYVPVK